jgi:hypothetical protein
MEASVAREQTVPGNPMATAQQAYLRTELLRRHERLESALQSPSADASLSSLLRDVDAALARMDAGTYGLCNTCHESIEAERLLSDPLLQFCLDDLTSEERRALESDLSLAARIQQNLLPPRDFSPAGWQTRYHYAPAGLVSGDYCDLFESNGSLLFLLGDVSGKGVAASMLMSHLHATFRSLADADLPLDRMVEAANRIFSESTMAGQFATLVVGRASHRRSPRHVHEHEFPCPSLFDRIWRYLADLHGRGHRGAQSRRRRIRLAPRKGGRPRETRVGACRPALPLPFGLGEFYCGNQADR